jgi:hypothetical protein
MSLSAGAPTLLTAVTDGLQGRGPHRARPVASAPPGSIPVVFGG